MILVCNQNIVFWLNNKLQYDEHMNFQMIDLQIRFYSVLFYENIPSFDDIIIPCEMANICMQWDESDKMEIPLQNEVT